MSTIVVERRIRFDHERSRAGANDDHYDWTALDNRPAEMTKSLILPIATIVLIVGQGHRTHATAQQTPAPQITASSPTAEQRDQPVSSEDVRILLRADELLKNESSWNRKDDRECTDDEASGKRSLFCALQKACIEVLGTYDHRRVALQEVRFAVEDATRGKDFEHRLRDFNNLPETHLADVKRVLRVATDRVKARLKVQQR